MCSESTLENGHGRFMSLPRKQQIAGRWVWPFDFVKISSRYAALQILKMCCREKVCWEREMCCRERAVKTYTRISKWLNVSGITSITSVLSLLFIFKLLLIIQDINIRITILYTLNGDSHYGNLICIVKYHLHTIGGSPVGDLHDTG